MDEPLELKRLRFWRAGWMRAWPLRKWPQNIKPFGRAWAAGIRLSEHKNKLIKPNQ